MRYVRSLEVKNSKGCREIIFQIWFTFLSSTFAPLSNWIKDEILHSTKKERQRDGAKRRTKNFQNNLVLKSLITFYLLKYARNQNFKIRHQFKLKLKQVIFIIFYWLHIPRYCAISRSRHPREYNHRFRFRVTSYGSVSTRCNLPRQAIWATPVSERISEGLARHQDSERRKSVFNGETCRYRDNLLNILTFLSL